MIDKIKTNFLLTLYGISRKSITLRFNKVKKNISTVQKFKTFTIFTTLLQHSNILTRANVDMQ
jgi:hypothetical protein